MTQQFIDKKTPRKPIPSAVTTEKLLEHYNARVAECNERCEDEVFVRMEAVAPEERGHLIDQIRKQNAILGHLIRPRAEQLLMTAFKNGEPGRPFYPDIGDRTVGYSYSEILQTLAVEFPECSTSAASLRWYVVHLWSEAEDEGRPRPVMPQYRPRSGTRKKKKAEAKSADSAAA